MNETQISIRVFLCTRHLQLPDTPFSDTSGVRRPDAYALDETYSFDTSISFPLDGQPYF